MKRILVTGAAGFIGRAVCEKLCQLGYQVSGLDNLNSYYDPRLKEDRLKTLKFENFAFFKADISSMEQLKEIFNKTKPECVINLAAQAGVRYSIENPDSYTKSNLVGFANILECCRSYEIKHLIFASSSSVYGNNKKVPFSETDPVDFPVSYYAATKKAGEVMAASYASLYKIPCTGLRFFTVIGPWGRPDMAAWLFTEAIVSGSPIKVFNNGNLQRDFTYIDDIVSGVIDLLPPPPAVNGVSFEIFNIGNNKPEKLMDFISILEHELGQKAKKVYLGMQKGDVLATYADISKIQSCTNFKPSTSLEEGLHKFVAWYKSYKKLG